MPRQQISAKCPHCEGPLLVHRAAPADGQIRVVCSDCGSGFTVGDEPIQVIRVPEPSLDQLAA